MGSLVFFFLSQYCEPHNVRANHNMQMGDQRGNCSNLFFCSFLFSLSDKPLSTLCLCFFYIFFFVFVFAFLFFLSNKPFSTILGFGELSHAVLLVLSKKSKFFYAIQLKRMCAEGIYIIREAVKIVIF